MSWSHKGKSMTRTQEKAQNALNKAYFAFQANPDNKTLANAYNKARNALFIALTQTA
jgi:hypothetical protein